MDVGVWSGPVGLALVSGHAWIHLATVPVGPAEDAGLSILQFPSIGVWACKRWRSKYSADLKVEGYVLLIAQPHLQGFLNDCKVEHLQRGGTSGPVLLDACKVIVTKSVRVCNCCMTYCCPCLQWQPIIEDRQFVSWLVKVPSDEERLRGRRLTMAQLTALEELWKARPEAALDDLDAQVGTAAFIVMVCAA